MVEHFWRGPLVPLFLPVWARVYVVLLYSGRCVGRFHIPDLSFRMQSCHFYFDRVTWIVACPALVTIDREAVLVLVSELRYVRTQALS